MSDTFCFCYQLIYYTIVVCALTSMYGRKQLKLPCGVVRSCKTTLMLLAFASCIRIVVDMMNIMHSQDYAIH
jgi:hypothetical protein